MTSNTIRERILKVIDESKKNGRFEFRTVINRDDISALQKEGFSVDYPKDDSIQTFLARVSFKNATFGYALHIRLECEIQKLLDDHRVNIEIYYSTKNLNVVCVSGKLLDEFLELQMRFKAIETSECKIADDIQDEVLGDQVAAYEALVQEEDLLIDKIQEEACKKMIRAINNELESMENMKDRARKTVESMHYCHSEGD